MYCFPGSSVVKNLPVNAGDTGDVVSIPRSGSSLRVGNGTPVKNSHREIPWTEEPGGPSTLRPQRVRQDSVTAHRLKMF